MAKQGNNRGRAVDTLDARFEFEEAFLAAPDKAALKSALIHARETATDEPMVLKYWEKTGTSFDADLRELWRHEMRQSDRVRAYPGADDVVVELSGSGETSDAFYIAMPGDLAPLNYAAKFARAGHWLHGLSSPRHRLVLWRNMRRIAIALSAVHGQGLVHGRIDQRSIFTGGAVSEPDFKLGGFEFCLRIADLGNAPLAAIGRSQAAGPVVFSFMEDWHSVGRVATGLLGLNPERLFAEEPEFLEGRQAVDMRAAELDALRLLLRPERNRALDAKVAISRIDNIVDELSAEALAGNGRYVLALRLGERSKLSAALAVASGDLFDTDDVDAQVAFVRADLEAGAQIARTTRGEILILTETLVYPLTPYRTPESGDTWTVATTNVARLREHSNYGRLQVVPLLPHRVEILRYGVAASRLRELRGDALDWGGAFDSGAGEDATVPVRRGLLLAQIAEALFKAAEIVPVDVVTQPRRQGDRMVVELSPSDAEVRLRLDEALRIPSPHRVMQRLFQDEHADFDAEWQISDSGGLGGTARASAGLRFVGTAQKQNRVVYEFQVTSGVMPPHAQLHLRKADDTGTEQALKRRLRMLAHLGTHAELATILGDPRSRLRTYRDEKLEEDEFLEKLDVSKQQALRSVWENGPNQFVVGPPGVGKTTLVTEAVRRKMAGDGTARILVSAQAHQALDHIAAAVQKVLTKAGLADETILVRSKADNGSDLAGTQTPERAKVFLEELERSPLVRAAPITIRRDITAMRAAADVTGDLRAKLDRSVLRQRRSFEALVLQSANILFSTVNSGDLERLVEDGAQFDWAIIEEAAKATGPELIAPQLLSMRRLLIGDHNQLPPFDTDRIDEFLADQTRVMKALRECDPVIGSIFRDFGLDELRDVLADEVALSETCAMARRMLLLFEAVVEVELERQKRSDQRRRTVATELLQQHRMHPVIAHVISECFYEGTLETDKDRADEFNKETPLFSSIEDRWPKSPIVFVDLPYMQTDPGAEEERPTYHNTAEREAVLAVLKMFKAAPREGKRPTLAVLSPYNEQSERLDLAITDRLEGELDNLAGFQTAPNAQGFASTVDSFQGSEADLVIVSLVRNNDHVGRQALGILSDRRRMNVLLSRAKWQIVIVGSLEFLRVQGRRYRKRQDSTKSTVPTFLARMIELFEEMREECLADGKTPKLTVLPIKSLMLGKRS